MDLNSQKRQLLASMIPLCPFVAIHVATKGVDIPQHLQELERVDFRIGENPQIMGIPDLVLDDWGWSGTLMFSGLRYKCSIPWEACRLFYVQEPFWGPFVTWPVEPPKSVQQPKIERKLGPYAAKPAVPSAAKVQAKSHLRLVKSED